MNRVGALPRLGMFDVKDPVGLARALSLYEQNVSAYLRDRATTTFGPFDRTAKQTSAVTARPWQYVRVDPTAAGVAVVLPRLADPNVKGSVIIVKNASASTKAITVSAIGTTIDGASTFQLSAARQCQWFYAGDDEWETYADGGDEYFAHLIVGLSAAQALGSNDLAVLNNGAVVSVSTQTGQRSFQAYQINSGPQGGRFSMFKARGTPNALTSPVNADGIGRFEVRAWDGTSWVQAGYLDFEVRSQFGSNISGSLPPVRAALNTFGPSYAANELASGTLQVPLSDTYHNVGQVLANNTPTVAVTGQTISNNTIVKYRVLCVGIDQVTGDMFERDVVVRVQKIGAGAATIRAATAGADPDATCADAGTAGWAVAFSIVSNQFVVTITSDATNAVHWSTYVWETAVPYP